MDDGGDSIPINIQAIHFEWKFIIDIHIGYYHENYKNDVSYDEI